MTISFSPKYEIGDYIYHVLPDSQKGLITDITYRYSTNCFMYEVTFEPDTIGLLYHEFELTVDKNVI